MVENFISEYSKLGEKNIMGIYGANHVKLRKIIIDNKSCS